MDDFSAVATPCNFSTMTIGDFYKTGRPGKRERERIERD
jgi:hypothetical protein